MNRKSRKNQESQNETMEKLKSVRLELKKIETDIKVNKERREELRKRFEKRDNGDSTVVRIAEKYLEGEEIPSQSIEEQGRILSERAELLRRAHQIKNAQLQPLLSEAARERKRAVMPEYIEVLQKKFEAIRLYATACDKESKLRQKFTDDGLPSGSLPPVNWPGLKVENLNRMLDPVVYRMKNSGFSEAEIKTVLDPLK